MTFFPHRFNGEQKSILDQIQTVLQHIQQYLPVTIRRIYYTLVSQEDPLISADRTGYRRVGYIINKARYSGLIPFSSIMDQTRYTLNRPRSLRELAYYYYPDALSNQSNLCWVIVEKQGQAPFYQSILGPLYVPVSPIRGFNSVSNGVQVAKELHKYADPVA